MCPLPQFSIAFLLPDVSPAPAQGHLPAPRCVPCSQMCPQPCHSVTSPSPALPPAPSAVPHRGDTPVPLCARAGSPPHHGVSLLPRIPTTSISCAICPCHPGVMSLLPPHPCTPHQLGVTYLSHLLATCHSLGSHSRATPHPAPTLCHRHPLHWLHGLCHPPGSCSMPPAPSTLPELRVTLPLRCVPATALRPAAQPLHLQRETWGPIQRKTGRKDALPSQPTSLLPRPVVMGTPPAWLVPARETGH